MPTDDHHPAHQPGDDGSDLARQVDEATRAWETQDFDTGASRFSRAVNAVAEVAGVGVFVTILAVVFVNASGRYALGATFIWGDELVIALLPWLGMLGMFLAIRRRQVIRIDFFAGLFPPRMRQTLEVLSSAVASGAFLYLAAISWDWFALFGSDRTMYLRIEKGWFMSAMLLGPALAAVAYVVVMVGDVRRAREEGARP